MKYLLIILIIANVYCACRSNEYQWNGLCLHCNSAPCSVCDGSSLCSQCFDGMWSRTRCDRCHRHNSMVINGRCRSCSEIDAELNGDYCRCNLVSGIGRIFGERRKCCNTVPGVYADGSTCKPCSKELIGCDVCDPPNHNGMLRCRRCSSGFNLVTIGGAAICVFNFHINDGQSNMPTCHESCLTCFGPRLSECLTCKAGLYFVHDSTPSTCLSDCPRGYRRVESPFRHCMNCGPGCATCTENIPCTECLFSGRVIKDREKCIPESECTNGYSPIYHFSSPPICKRCGDGCRTCNEANSCLTCCYTGQIPWGGICVQGRGYRSFLSSGIAVALLLLILF